MVHRARPKSFLVSNLCIHVHIAYYKQCFSHYIIYLSEPFSPSFLTAIGSSSVISATLPSRMVSNACIFGGEDGEKISPADPRLPVGKDWLLSYDRGPMPCCFAAYSEKECFTAAFFAQLCIVPPLWHIATYYPPFSNWPYTLFLLCMICITSPPPSLYHRHTTPTLQYITPWVKTTSYLQWIWDVVKRQYCQSSIEENVQQTPSLHHPVWEGHYLQEVLQKVDYKN